MAIKSLTIILFLSIQLATSFGQETIKFSKKEMKEDFEYFERCIDSLNPHLPIFNKLMSYNVEDSLRVYKRCIDTVTSITSFFVILKKGLNLIQEDHSGFLGEKELKYPTRYYLNNYPNYFEEDNKKAAISFFQKIGDGYPFDERTSERFRTCQVNIRYINGKYYNIFPVLVCEGIDTTKIPIGYELTRINGIPCDSFLYAHLNDYLFARHSYDITLKKFYNEMLTTPLTILASKDDLFLSFKSSDNSVEFEVKYAGKGVFKIYTAQFQLGIIQTEKCPKVLLIGNILYIRIPEMNLSYKDYFINKIRGMKKLNISKVVLDVRNNGGGSDYLWNAILSEIIDNKIDIRFRLGFRDSRLFKPFFEKNITEYPLYNDSILKMPYRLLSDNNEIAYSIVPSDSSIRFSGKIFVLHNQKTFSSANSLVTLANSNDILVSVGESSGKLGGFGIDPKLFQLPNSKLIFRMHSTIHLPYNPKSIEDYFWNKTEIQVVTNPQFENIMYEYQSKDIYTEDFLINKDIYFQKVIEYGSSSK